MLVGECSYFRLLQEDLALKCQHQGFLKNVSKDVSQN